eukprot:scaffold27955_cov119-Skeletonema_dohrnii-CCMP3373.AAC.1
MWAEANLAEEDAYYFSLVDQSWRMAEVEQLEIGETRFESCSDRLRCIRHTILKVWILVCIAVENIVEKSSVSCLILVMSVELQRKTKIQMSVTREGFDVY